MAYSVPTQLPYQPRFPGAGANEAGLRADLPGIGIIGCGNIVKSAHLKAYVKYGLPVIGVYDISAEATRGVKEQFGVRQIYDSLDALFENPEIQVVDIATHPEARIPLMQRALQAGKHILAQKPLALDMGAAREVVAEAARRGLQVAVNQNGRWAPPWRVATLLIEQGAIGEVLAITHLYDISFNWIPGTHFDRLEHFAIYDYSVHWIDITRCWLEGQRITGVRAVDYRTPHQPDHGKTPWGMWVEITCDDGAHAMIRGVGCSQTRHRGHPFWIHGTEGTLRGSVLGNDYVELERDGVSYRFDLAGQWFPDGFAGTMGELLCAIAEKREPYNSARHNLLSLELTLAACDSANAHGALVKLVSG
ncbi:MAG: Gfo/Idh/MocA family oxidoreductase [Chloroflexi bacterium]|nr:Gfo/Idh/MocA family oxidoreductase [Chloroflexota bacterium]